MKEIIIGGFAVLIFLVSATTITTPAKTQTTIVSDDLFLIDAKVQTLFKQGYRVVSVTPQSVSTSVNSRTNTPNAYNAPYRDVKGQVYVILEK